MEVNLAERGGGGGRPRTRTRRIVSDGIQVTVVDHVLNLALTLRENGQRVQHKLSHFTIASIIQTLQKLE
jgi:hypothetical protein